ncbi:hypothetical protein BJX76DRAFT_306380 [Aspergillus varians]
MRTKHGAGFTLRSLFSRCSKRARSGKGAKRTSISTNNDSTLILQTTSAKAIFPLDKELEILGLLTDPRNTESQPISWYSPSSPAAACTLSNTKTPHTYTLPPIYPHPQLGLEEQDEDAITPSRQSLLPPPPSPLLPPAPSLWPPLQSSRSGQESAEIDNNVPPSPSAQSYRTFATRSSGVFPWGMEPRAVEDGGAYVADTLSEDQVLVLPSPPRFAHSYGYGYGVGCR